MFEQWLQKIGLLKKKDTPSIKILIVEDNPVDAKLMQEAVAVCGCTSFVASDGKTGVEMAQRHKPNLIILDYHLPDINGGQVLKELRSNKETSSDTVMVLTILDKPGVIKDSFEQGADRYSVKPINVTVLAKQIQFLLEHPHKD
jgi:DNA-binding response OmpR family regulator